MVSSWSIETTDAKDHGTLNEVIDTGFYVDQREDNKQVTADQFKENMWIFGGMRGFKKR